MLDKFNGKENKIIEYALVSIQLVSISYIIIFTQIGILPLSAIVIALIGFILGVYSVLIMKPGNFHVLPRPLEQSQLITAGPYRYIRHPMYTSLLVVASALIGGDFSVGRFVIGLVLAICLVIKLEYEETLLIKKFPEYEYYRKITKRIIPFLW